MRAQSSTMPPRTGIGLPSRLEPAPRAVSGIAWAAASFTTATTSSVERGHTTASGRAPGSEEASHAGAARSAGRVGPGAGGRAQFVLESGEAELARFRSSDHGTRSFCRRCGSSLFCESTRHPDQIDIVLANTHGPIDRPPQFHVYFDDRADWVVVNDGLPRLG